MIRKRKLLWGTIAVLVFGVGMSSMAGKENPTFEDWSKDKKLEKKMMIGAWGQSVKKLKAEGARPKKVGLITHMIWNFGQYEFSALAYQYGGTYMRSSGLSGAGGNHFASRLAQESVPNLKEAFRAHGMELLTPDEFADTDEKKNTYLEFELPFGKLAKTTMAVVDRLRKNPELTTSALGFKAIPAHLWASDKKARLAMEELRKAMGLDAVVVVCSETRSSEWHFGVAKIDLMMFGHNFDPMPPQKIAQYAWADMVPYASGTFGKGFKGSTIALLKKGEIKSEDYTGFGAVVGALARAVLTKFDEVYEMGKPAD